MEIATSTAKPKQVFAFKLLIGRAFADKVTLGGCGIHRQLLLKQEQRF